MHDILPFLYDAYRILPQRIDHVGDGVGEVLQDPFGLPPSSPGVVMNVASGGFPGLGREE